MLLRRLVPLALVAMGLVAVLIGAGLLPLGREARALPPAGTDIVNVTAQVSVTSRLGSETIDFAGTATIQRGEPRTEAGREVASVEITALSVQGTSVTGPVTVTESADRVSSGEVRSLLADAQFPASSFFDAFIEAQVPASGGRTPPRVHNEVALHLVPMSGGSEVPVTAWPPVGTTYQAEPEAPVGSHCADGLPLLPPLPAEICLTSISITIGEVKAPPETATPCPTELCTPTPSSTPTRTPTGAPPTPTPTRTPVTDVATFSVAAGGPSGLHPADLLGLNGDVLLPSDNDNFANAWQITTLPFTGAQGTIGMTTEPGEPLNPNNCVTVSPNAKGATVWYRFRASQAGTVQADTGGSNFDTVLAAYTGTALNALTPVACNDDSEAFDLQSLVSFPATAGTTYYLQAGGFSAISGELRLNVSLGGGGAGEEAFAVRIPCASLGLTTDGCDDGADGTQDDVDALSYGADFTGEGGGLAFSVAPGSAGLPGTAVAEQAACSPAQPQADEFAAPMNGTNTLLFDGDGLNGDCPAAPPLGLRERPSSDDLDALNDRPPSSVDQDGDQVPDELVFFSLAAGSPTLAAIGRGGADILWTLGGFQPGVYVSAADLGLQPGDDIDALCLADQGEGAPRFEAAADVMRFSLASGSPTLAALGASAADVLGPGPAVVAGASSLGLRAEDDLDALQCAGEAGPPPPPPTATAPATRTVPPTATRTPTPGGVVGDVNCRGGVNSIDAALVLQFVAGRLRSLPCRQNADVNRDGRIDSVDAALILQRVAGLISRLPP